MPDATPDAMPNAAPQEWFGHGELRIPMEALRAILTAARDAIGNARRAMIVIVFDGRNIPTHASVRTDPPFAGTDQFALDCERIWTNYSVSRTIPVVLCRLLPSPFTGIGVVPLPWADVGAFCQHCGSTEHLLAECHR